MPRPGATASPVRLKAGAWEEVRPQTAGWRYLSFRVLRLAPGGRVSLGDDREELAAVVLAGAAVVRGPAAEWQLPGRPSVFEGPPWSVYLPPGARVTVEARGALELAVVGAQATEGGEPRLVTPDDVEVEIRGAGSATRQINHILPPAFPAQHLLVAEVLTPAGNWSSYPPHKHDLHRPPEEVALEEFYYFHIRPPHGFAFQRVYSPDRGVDLSVAVADGDVVLVPYGYHVSAAPHGFDLYYLNGLAGEVRAMAAADDPAMAYIRRTWEGMDRDPRVPMSAPSGEGSGT